MAGWAVVGVAGDTEFAWVRAGAGLTAAVDAGAECCWLITAGECRISSHAIGPPISATRTALSNAPAIARRGAGQPEARRRRSGAGASSAPS
jgi:hypothetical protein